MTFFSPVSIVIKLRRRRMRSAGLESKLVTLEDGTVMHFWVPGPGYKAPPDAPPLLLLHGFAGLSSLEWSAQAKDLGAPHFRLYVPDLVFLGDSTSTSQHRSELFQAQSVVEGLRALLGASARVHAVGTSYGGFVLYRIAQQWPEVLGKVVFSDSGVAMTPATHAGLVARHNVKDITELLVPSTPQGVGVVMGAAFYKTPPLPAFNFVHKDYLNVVAGRNREQKCELLHGTVLGSADAPPLTPLPHEALIIWGEHDQIFDISLAHQLQGLLAAGTRIVVIKDAGHVPQEEAAKEYSKELLAFLLEKPQTQEQTL